MSYNPHYLSATQLCIQEIIFDDDESASVFCSFHLEFIGRVKAATLSVDLDELLNLLKASNQDGIYIKELIEEKLHSYIDYPTVIEVSNLLGKSLLLKDQVLVVYPYEDEMEEDSNIFFLVNIDDTPLKQQLYREDGAYESFKSSFFTNPFQVNKN